MYTDLVDLEKEAQRSLQRLLPQIESELAEQITKDPQTWKLFNKRLDQHFSSLFQLYYQIYAERYDFFYHLAHFQAL